MIYSKQKSDVKLSCSCRSFAYVVHHYASLYLSFIHRLSSVALITHSERGCTASSTTMYDPQQLSTLGSIKALFALGRIPLASEVPLWTFFGCLLSAQIYGHKLDWLITLQCILVVWGTNISINYGNEYFDYDMDRPGMVESIEKDVRARQKLEQDLKAKSKSNGNGNGSAQQQQEARETMRKEFGNEKIMGSSSRIIHDGTFPAYAALLCAAFVQALLLAMILVSRTHYSSSTLGDSLIRSHRHTPFKGLALQIGGMCTFLSHSYVGPPFRLHYHGLGELVSAFFLSPVAVLFGMVGHYTASTGRSIPASDLFAKTSTTSMSGFYLDKQLWYMLLAFYFFEQARIFIMHIHDIPADRAGGKITFVVRIGYDWAKRLYVVFNIISAMFFTLLARTMVEGEGLIMRTNSPIKLGLHGRSSSIVAGLGALGAFAIPIILITAKSLYYHSPSNQGKPHTASTIPILPHADLAKIVSLQTLLSPVILSIAFLVVSPK